MLMFRKLLGCAVALAVVAACGGPSEDQSASDLPAMPSDKDYPCSRSTDADGDGAKDSVEFYTYEPSGREIELDQDDDADGHIDHRNKFLFDSAGRSAGTLIYNNDDALVDVRVKVTWDGNTQTAAYDFSDDGTVDYTRIGTFDADERLLSTESYGDTGELIDAHRLTYDTDGNVISDVYESDRDPTKNSTSTYAYDGSGNWVTTDVDQGSDGTIEFHTTVERDTAGVAHSALVESGEGEALGSYAWDYDAKGRLLKYTQDNGPDGSVDMTQFYTYECWK